MTSSGFLVVFEIEGQRHALSMALVERVVRAVALTPAPHAPPSVAGLINVQGTLVPVVNTRRWLGLPERPVRPSDHFLILRFGGRALALPADQVRGVMARTPQSEMAGGEAAVRMGSAAGVVKDAAGMILVHSPEELGTLPGGTPWLEAGAAVLADATPP